MIYNVRRIILILNIKRYMIDANLLYQDASSSNEQYYDYSIRDLGYCLNHTSFRSSVLVTTTNCHIT